VASADGVARSLKSPVWSDATTRWESIWWRCWSTIWRVSGRSRSSCSTTWPSARSIRDESRSWSRASPRVSIGANRAARGETAEHGGVMRPDELDVAGLRWGDRTRRGTRSVARARRRRADRFRIAGLRSNGYSLARKVLIADEAALGEEAFPGSPRNLGDELLVPSAIYAPAVVSLRRELGAALHAARTSRAAGSSQRRAHPSGGARCGHRYDEF